MCVAFACVAASQVAQANLPGGGHAPLPGIAAGADAQGARAARSPSRLRPAAPAARPPAAGPGARATSPLRIARSTAAGQTGYVHFFLLRLPDGAAEIQVGIELPDQRIAWSFPGLGVAISPFIDDGTLAAGGNSYDVWHLYGNRH